jgi:hypothetical protein
MTTDNQFIATEAVTQNAFAQFNAFESAVPSALKETPYYAPETFTPVSEKFAPQVGLYDSAQSKPFEITDDQGRVIATASDPRNNVVDIARGGTCDVGQCDVDASPAEVVSSCSGGTCPCSEYRVRGWNRGPARGQVAQSSYSDCDDGSCDDGDEDPGDCGPGGCDDDGGDCGPGGGLLRGLLARFGRGGLFGRLMGGGGGLFGRMFR